MAITHETEHRGGGHPSLQQYIVIAILLFAITIVEFIIIMDFPGPREKVISDALGQPSTTILLFLLSGIKFAIVILFYMHLKFDNKLFFWMFVAGMVLAVMVGLSLIGLFTAVKPTLGGRAATAGRGRTLCLRPHDRGTRGERVPGPHAAARAHPGAHDSCPHDYCSGTRQRRPPRRPSRRAIRGRGTAAVQRGLRL